MKAMASPLSNIKIREITNEIRESIGYEKIERFPIVEFVEVILPATLEDEFNFEICTVEELGSCEGLTTPDENLIQIREDVYDKAVTGDGRARFTIAHELGHFFLHISSSLSFHRNDKDDIPTYMDPEWQANKFATELLIPRDLLLSNPVRYFPDEIVALCRVSKQAAEIAVKQIYK